METTEYTTIGEVRVTYFELISLEKQSAKTVKARDKPIIKMNGLYSNNNKYSKKAERIRILNSLSYTVSDLLKNSPSCQVIGVPLLYDVKTI